MARSLVNILVAASLALAASACGGAAPGPGGSPTGPSSSSGAVASGAVISGTVTGRRLATASLGPTLEGVSTLTVTIAGTDLTVTVDATGHFEISGVPAGNIELLFRDGSSTWTVVIAGVVAEEQIQIQINLSSGTPKIVSEARSLAKVRLCHLTDSNRYQPIEISVSSEATHRAHGDAAVGEPVPADTTKVFNANCQVVPPSISLVKSTNGEDANVAPGPSIKVGNPVTWTYVVTNHGLVPLTNVTVVDDKGVIVDCLGVTTLAPGASMTCTGTGVAIAGQYINIGTASADAAGVAVSHSDPSHYWGEAETDEPAGPKVKLCHRRGKAGYQLIEVAAAAERAHRAHGDAAIGEPVPLEAGKTFGPACAVAP